MNILKAITNAPDDAMVDIRSEVYGSIKSFPVKDLQAVLAVIGTPVPQCETVTITGNGLEPYHYEPISYGGTD